MNKYEFAVKINAHGLLEPINVHDKIMITQELKQNKVYKCKLTNARNIKSLGLYWLLMKALAFHFPEVASSDFAWHEYYKFKFLPKVEFKTKDGIMLFPSSIAFDKMDQLEFSDYLGKISNHLEEKGYSINELIETMMT